MATLFRILRSISRFLNIIAGVAVTFMMLLTVADVLLRAGGHPIIGTFEIVALLLALVIGFLIAAATHSAKATARPLVTVSTGGLGNPLLATIELAGSLVTSLLSLVVPVLVVVLIAILLLLLGLKALKRRRRKKQ